LDQELRRLERKRQQVDGAWAPRVVALAAAALFLLGCESPAAPDSGSAPAAAEAPPSSKPAFSSARAWRHLVRLSKIGPRSTGTRGAERARRYFGDQLERNGLASSELRVPTGDDPARDLVHVVAELPGESEDLVLVVAHYDTRAFESFDFVGANASASGPAVLLELARVLALSPQLYTHRFVLVDGDAAVDEDGTPSLRGSRALARILAENDELRRIRLAVFYDRVGDADLQIARDLRSNRAYRETFWSVARSLDLEDAFSRESGFESPVSGHRPFLEHGLRRVVAMVDTRFGGDDPPGLFADTPDDIPRRCSEDSLAAVGAVSLEGLERISKRLAKIDRFAKSPLAFDPELAASRSPSERRPSAEPTSPVP